MKVKHLFLALVIGTLAFASCKKQEAEIQPTSGDRTPLAMRTTSGEIVSLVDCEKLTTQLNTSKDGENYIVESVEVVDKTDSEPYYFIVNLIDVEREKSISCAYIGDYVEEVSNIFYAVEDFEQGNYRVTDYQTNQEFKFVNHNNVEPNDPTPCYTSGFWISCEGEGCKNGTCKPHYFHCPDCESLDANNPGACTFSGLGWGSSLIIGFLGSLIRALF
ncbi:MAG: hypothetical protein J5767_15445 [Paludibacteraceae bacterium]|nr:hypothetical protein [Paludibacteraceae bacterium]